MVKCHLCKQKLKTDKLQATIVLTKKKNKVTMEPLLPFCFFFLGRNLFFLVLLILIPNRSCVNCVHETNYWLHNHFFHLFFFIFSKCLNVSPSWNLFGLQFYAIKIRNLMSFEQIKPLTFLCWNWTRF